MNTTVGRELNQGTSDSYGFTTARYYDAINASVAYHANWYTFQFKYERIAPEYQTLGAYFFDNDMQNITVVPSVRLLKNTLNLSANVGLQQNNLDRSRVYHVENRWIA